MTILFLLYNVFSKDSDVSSLALGIVLGLATDAFLLAFLALLK